MIDAMACHRAGAPLEPFAYEPAPLAAHDCEIAVSHCGICHSDLHLVDDDWGVTRYPLVPGHEIVGTVTAAGSAAEALLGRRVGVGWQRSACLACEDCCAGRENLCPASQATCVGNHGGFAGRIRVDSRFAFPLPDALESAAAAPLMCAGATVYSPLRRYGAGPGMRVAVAGIGGLGHLALKFARALGAEVTALSSSPDKAADALRLGADDFVATDALKSCARRFDLLLTTISAAQPWAAYLATLRTHGALCFVGVPDQPISAPVSALMKSERTMSASAIGSRVSIREMLDFAAAHGIGAEVEAMPLAKVNDALARLADNRVRYRVVLDT